MATVNHITDQYLSGQNIINFGLRPFVNGTGVLLSGEGNETGIFATITGLNQVSGNLQGQVDILNVNSIAYAIALG